jgi:hypothetical protein
MLTETKSPHGYRLLQLLRTYLIIDTYSAMEVHTEKTISDGREEVKIFERKMTVYLICYHPHCRLLMTCLLGICTSYCRNF